MDIRQLENMLRMVRTMQDDVLKMRRMVEEALSAEYTHVEHCPEIGATGDEELEPVYMDWNW